MTTFTKGPWKVYGYGLYMDELAGHKHGCIFADNNDNDGDGRTICDISQSKRVVHKDKRRHDEFAHTQEDEGNARLIASAPEMHALLVRLTHDDLGEDDFGGMVSVQTDRLITDAREILAKVEGEK